MPTDRFIKIAMEQLHEALAPYRARMVLQVHDELVLEVPEEELEVAKEACRVMMAELRKCRDLLAAAEDECLKANELLKILGWEER